MASSQRMMMIGMIFLVGTFALTVMAWLGGIIFKYILDFFGTITIAPVLAQSAGQMFWVLPLYYTVIVVMEIVLIYRCYQETVIVTDYYPDQGVY